MDKHSEGLSPPAALEVVAHEVIFESFQPTPMSASTSSLEPANLSWATHWDDLASSERETTMLGKADRARNRRAYNRKKAGTSPDPHVEHDPFG